MLHNGTSKSTRLRPLRSLSRMVKGFERQSEFLFVDGWVGKDEKASGAAPRTLDEEIAAAWKLPLRRQVRVQLRGHDVPGATGLLEVAQAPDLPFDPHKELRLRIGHVEFSHRQIESLACV